MNYSSEETQKFYFEELPDIYLELRSYTSYFTLIFRNKKDDRRIEDFPEGVEATCFRTDLKPHFRGHKQHRHSMNYWLSSGWEIQSVKTDIQMTLNDKLLLKLDFVLKAEQTSK